MVKGVSIFSGAGGLDVGAHQAGVDIVACIENDSRRCPQLSLWIAVVISTFSGALNQ